MSSSTHCLNCGSHIDRAYCPDCGQTVTTHRLSIKHFVAHDMVHGIFHLDRGIFYTIRELFARPGNFVHGYIAGKRAGHFNVVTLLILLVGVHLYVHGFDEIFRQKTQNAAVGGTKNQREIVEGIRHFFQHNFKWIMLCMIPVFSLSSFWVFRRRKYFYTEHLVANGYFFAGYLMINILLTLILKLPFLETLRNTDMVLFVSSLFLLAGYWQAWKYDYKFIGWLYRMLLCFLLSFLVIIILLIVIIGSYIMLTKELLNS